MPCAACSRRQRGQTMVEVAVTLPLLLVVAIGLVQFAVWAHAENVVIASVQDGARTAAASGASVTDGVRDAEALLHAGIGQDAADVVIAGQDQGAVVTLHASGGLRAAIPWVATVILPLDASASVAKEQFSAGPTG